MINKLSQFIELLNASGIRYCHWKSNISLPAALAGLTDIDLLVHRQDADRFRALLTQQQFRPAASCNGRSFPSTEHYFGFDADSGVLVHIHAYFRVITGESLAKNFHLPIEDMLLENTRDIDCVRVPTKGAELVVFTIRMMLKHTTVVELALLIREGSELRREADFLIDEESLAEASGLLQRWLPLIDARLFAECVQALRTPAPLVKRVSLARRLRSSLRVYARQSQLRASWVGITSFCRMAFRSIAHRPKGMVLRSGGALVAFVGPEATGKSTILSAVRCWLGEHFVVEHVHVGKPRPTLITFFPSLIVPLLRLLVPRLRPSKLETDHPALEGAKPSSWIYPVSFAIRAVLLAHDRRVLLSRAFAQAANGTIVLCDRYPYVAPGSPDGPRLMHYPLQGGRYPFRRMLALVEQRLYEQMPTPDLIIALTTPVEVAVARNRTRGKYEPEEYVRRRHATASSIPVSHAPVISINTNRELEATLFETKNLVWSVL